MIEKWTTWRDYITFDDKKDWTSDGPNTYHLYIFLLVHEIF